MKAAGLSWNLDSDTNFPEFGVIVLTFSPMKKPTIMYTFTDRLERFHIDGSCTSIITIVFIFFVAHNTISALRRCQNCSSPACYARNDCPCVKRQYRWISIDRVRVEDLRESQ